MNLSKHFACLLVAASVLAGRAEGLQLGDSRRQVEARYDTAPVGDHQKGTAIYRWDTWKLEIQYTADVAHTLVYSKLDPITDGEITTILEQNGGFSHWHAAATALGRTSVWTRTDGATATFDVTKERTLTLHGDHMPPPAPDPATQQVSAQAGKPAAPGLPASKPAQAVPQVSAPAKPLQAMQIAPPAKPHPAARAVAAATPLSIFSSMIQDASHRKGTYIILGLVVFGIIMGAGMDSIKRTVQGPRRAPAQGGAPPGASQASGQSQPPALTLVPTMESIGWQQFELLMGEVFRRKGYEVEISSGDGADGGVDLWLRKDGALVLAQCKQYLSGKVGAPAIREFFGVITHENAAKGIFINTSVYTPDARDFAVGKKIDLLDGEDVKELINSVTRPGENIYDIQGWLAGFTAAAVIRHPDCPFRKTPMVLRDSRHGRFWGCSDYPGCQGKRDARMELLGDALYQPK